MEHRIENQYLFFTTVIGNESLLKEEIKKYHPYLNLSYSQKGLLTFKNTKQKFSLKEVSDLNFVFSLRHGIGGVKSNSEDLEANINNLIGKYRLENKNIIRHYFGINTDYECDSIASSIGDAVINIMKTGEDKFWIGVHYHGPKSTAYPNSDPQVVLPEESPSRAYLKMAEAVELFNIKTDSRDTWIEYGCAPGGASYYLLQKGCLLYGNDPADMDSICLNNKNFVHLKKPVQNLSQEELPEIVDWVTVDLNLNPKQGLKEVLRLSKKHIRSLKGILFTIKMVNESHIKNIKLYKNEFDQFGFKSVRVQQLPSHKKEFLICARKLK